ncbi:hypothetical protein [Paenibacillus sp. GCM10027626]|uniref:hypothetical protein n=1 Tax=Paenibacillus sp. GCM10027626 TaxID=3273411 RepID=UPI00363C73C8
MKSLLTAVLAAVVVMGTTACTKEESIQIVKEEEKADSQRVVDAGQWKEGRFAFADESGTKLLTTNNDGAANEDQDKLKGLNRAIGAGGQIVSVRYIGAQQATDQDNGRQTAGNFANLAGDLFELTEGQAEANETYFLLPDAVLPKEALLTVTVKSDRTVDAAITKQIEKQKERKIESIWAIAEVGEEHPRTIYVMQFVRQDNDMLASLAVERQDGTLLFQDYPAEYDEFSTWRVDDGGEISEGMFSILLAAKTGSGLLLGVKWMGAEGENVFFLQQQEDKLQDIGLRDGRYMSPI